MENNEINKIELRKMFDSIRNEEIKNIKVTKYTDKQMIKRIATYIYKTVGGDKNEV